MLRPDSMNITTPEVQTINNSSQRLPGVDEEVKETDEVDEEKDQ